MKNTFIAILFCVIFSNSYGDNNDSLIFIIISRLGITGYSFPSLILSADSITHINYDDNYEGHLKYKYYDNFVVNYGLLKRLHSLLNLTIKPEERQKGFSREYMFIVDYRVHNDSCDYVLVSSTTLMSTLFALKSIYCLLINDVFENEYLLKKVIELYVLYINSYKAEAVFNKNISCP